MSAPVVLCLDFDSYVCAVAAMETLAGQIPESAARIDTAVADFKRAYATCHAIDSLGTPALLRRQI